MPNLMQTLEGTPAFVHAGPFANIAHGNSSILADQIALKLSADLCGHGIRLRRRHGHGEVLRHQVPRKRAGPRLRRRRGHHARPENARRRAGSWPQALAPLTPMRTWSCSRRAARTSVKHIQNARRFGVSAVVVAIESVHDGHGCRDRDGAARTAIAAGAEDAVMADHWAEGGAGAVELAEGRRGGLREAEQFPSSIRSKPSIEQKIETHRARDVRGRRGRVSRRKPKKKIELYTRQGFDRLPSAMAKTHLSLSHDPKLKSAHLRSMVRSGYVAASVEEALAAAGRDRAPCLGCGNQPPLPTLTWARWPGDRNLSLNRQRNWDAAAELRWQRHPRPWPECSIWDFNGRTVAQPPSLDEGGRPVPNSVLAPVPAGPGLCLQAPFLRLRQVHLQRI